MHTITADAYSGDIAARLKNWRGLHLAHGGELFEEAAAEIERLRAEVERLRQLGRRNAQDLREYAAALGGEMADMVADECKITVKRMF